MAEVKAGVKTSEFWGTTLVQLLTFGATIFGTLQPAIGIPVIAAIQGIYNIARGLAKKSIIRGEVGDILKNTPKITK
jgi:hypothetical protein